MIICIFNKFPSDADVAGPGVTLDDNSSNTHINDSLHMPYVQ